MIQSTSFPIIADHVRSLFIEFGQSYDIGEWQSFRDPDLPMTKTFEVEDISFKWIRVPDHVGQLQEAVRPNLPWAEDHFQERISGKPLNPGVQYKNWPWYEQGVEDHKPAGQFSHTYMERYWPPRLYGIRFNYGGLDNLVELLRERPHTRQAYLPIWYPEDLDAAYTAGERVPCTLGYHFLIRNQELKVVYYMRSCDWFRYFRDDVYMTARLQQWVAKKVGVWPGSLVMHISSLHIFEPEIGRLREEQYARARTK